MLILYVLEGVDSSPSAMKSHFLPRLSRQSNPSRKEDPSRRLPPDIGLKSRPIRLPFLKMTFMLLALSRVRDIYHCIILPGR